MSRGELHVAVQMFVAYRDAERRVLERIAAAGFEDLTLAQARLAARLADEGSRLTDLADEAGVTKQTAHVLVKQLTRAGFVAQVPDPSDGRAKLVVLAERGRRVQSVARSAEREIADEWRAQLGERGWRKLGELMELIAGF